MIVLQPSLFALVFTVFFYHYRETGRKVGRSQIVESQKTRVDDRGFAISVLYKNRLEYRWPFNTCKYRIYQADRNEQKQGNVSNPYKIPALLLYPYLYIIQERMYLLSGSETSFLRLLWLMWTPVDVRTAPALRILLGSVRSKSYSNFSISLLNHSNSLAVQERSTNLTKMTETDTPLQKEKTIHPTQKFFNTSDHFFGTCCVAWKRIFNTRENTFVSNTAIGSGGH